MKVKCGIIRDLFPSYIDGLTCCESNKLIEEHLEECRECREYLNEMKADVAEEDRQIENKKEIQPFQKLRQKTRKKIILAAAAGVLVCGLVFCGGFLYYGRTWTADSQDVKMSIDAQGGIATIRFTPEKKNYQLYVQAEENNRITIIEKKRMPFTKAYNPNAYWSCTFVDENTTIGAEGQNTDFDEDQVLTIQYEDRTETISLTELAQQALENPPAQSDEVKMTWAKEDNGTVTMGFFPEILGVNLKVEDLGEDQILIRQYYEGEGESVENGDFYTINFIDENTIQLPDGTERTLKEGDSLKIEYKDKTEKILFSDLWKGSLSAYIK